mmetsp:Transcript_46535/g.145904  ORF Transcript_46535/g.145904 Transcript_46535/m.145904 type:complete len:205 (-) Transcript_46535:63-677(-)
MLQPQSSARRALDLDGRKEPIEPDLIQGLEGAQPWLDRQQLVTRVLSFNLETTSHLLLLVSRRWRLFFFRRPHVRLNFVLLILQLLVSELGSRMSSILCRQTCRHSKGRVSSLLCLASLLLTLHIKLQLLTNTLLLCLLLLLLNFTDFVLFLSRPIALACLPLLLCLLVLLFLFRLVRTLRLLVHFHRHQLLLLCNFPLLRLFI